MGVSMTLHLFKCEGCLELKQLLPLSCSNDIDRYYCRGCYEARTFKGATESAKIVADLRPFDE
jgi:hypothetical protein